MKRPGKGTCVCVANELEVVQKLNLEDNLPPQLLEHQFRTESGACKSVLTPKESRSNPRVPSANIVHACIANRGQGGKMHMSTCQHMPTYTMMEGLFYLQKGRLTVGLTWCRTSSLCEAGDGECNRCLFDQEPPLASSPVVKDSPLFQSRWDLQHQSEEIALQVGPISCAEALCGTTMTWSLRTRTCIRIAMASNLLAM